MTPRAAIASRNRRSVHAHWNTHTHIYYKVHYTRVRLRLRWSEIWGPFRCFFTLDMQLKMIENLRGSSVNGRFSQISLQLAVTSWWDCPCFCLPESCFSLPPLKTGREKLPSSRDPRGFASGGNIHWQTSTVRKYTQWDRAVQFLILSGSRTWELFDWLYSVILARRKKIRRVDLIAKFWLQMDVKFFSIHANYTDCRLPPVLQSYRQNLNCFDRKWQKQTNLLTFGITGTRFGRRWNRKTHFKHHHYRFLKYKLHIVIGSFRSKICGCHSGLRVILQGWKKSETFRFTV